MKKLILNLKGAQELSKNEQKKVNGGKRIPSGCGGDGSFIIVGGEVVCCYISPGLYLC